MTIFGVAGSVALLFAGLGMSSSMGGIGERQFGDIIKYDAVISQKNHISQKERADLNHLLSSSKITQKGSIYHQDFTKTIKGLKDEQTISLLVTPEKEFQHFNEMYDIKKKSSLKLSTRCEVI